MNADRRKRLGAAMNHLATTGQLFTTPLQELEKHLEATRDMLDEVRNEEQEAYDALPESIQNGERGSTMSDAIDQLDEAIAGLGELIETAQQLIAGYDDINSAIDNARGC